MTGTPTTWLHSRRGTATLATAALVLGGVGLTPAFSAMSAPAERKAHVVFTGCLATGGDGALSHVVRGRHPARHHECPAGSVRVHWNAKGRAGADGAAGAEGGDGIDGTPGTNGADGSAGTDGVAGADGADGADGARGRAGPGSLVSSGVFTLLSAYSVTDTFAYLPLTGYLPTQAVAPWLDTDAMVTEAAHTSVEQVIAQDETVTDIVANFGSTTDLRGQHTLTVELTLLVSAGGTDLLRPAAGCIFPVDGNGPTTHECALSGDQAVHLYAGDTAVLYVKPYVGGWEPNVPIEVYGSVALRL